MQSIPLTINQSHHTQLPETIVPSLRGVYKYTELRLSKWNMGAAAIDRSLSYDRRFRSEGLALAPLAGRFCGGGCPFREPGGLV